MNTALKVQLLALCLYAIDYNVDLEDGVVEVSQYWGRNLFFVSYHGLLFLLVIYFLVPRLLYPRHYFGFAVAVLALVSVFACGEELGLERLLFPDSRGRDAMSVDNLLYYFGEVGFPLLGLLSLKVLTDADATRLRLQQLEQERLGSELRALRSQIQPHILFNSLNNLYEYILRGEKAAPELVLRLSRVLRYVLYETRADRVELAGEIRFLTDYLSLQKMQLEGRGELAYQITPPERSYEIAPFLLIPFVENCFKHSLGSLPTGIDISVQLTVVDGELRLHTHNNYAQRRDGSQDLTYSGIGLDNVRKRLALLYSDRHELHIEDTGTDFRVALHLKLGV
ncbi:MAG: histidine kinase [Bacteroidota bacterium]